ncbi:MAG: hypothetical protein CHACPFDD_01067 [Phycisphaerae bacterium]|nr:hypothetical protein [Phycisphaerae bacterium]
MRHALDYRNREELDSIGRRRFRPHAGFLLVGLAWLVAPAYAQPHDSPITIDVGSPVIRPGQVIKAPTHRNILLIIADDFGVDMLTSYGEGTNPPPTPNLHALRQRGVLFRNVWTNPVCSATRATLLTGRYGFRTGVGWVIEDTAFDDPLNEFTIPDALDANPLFGYSHAAIGKWHLTSTANIDAPRTVFGFSHFAGSALGGGLPDYWDWDWTEDGTTTGLTDTYATTKNVEDALSWIDGQDGPWFLWLAFNAPHTPLHKPPDDLHSFDFLSGTDEDIAEHPVPYYKAMVEAMDTEIGRLLDSLPQATLNNTDIIFLGDNGSPADVTLPPFDPDHAKGTIYEGGINVPLLIAGPDVVSPNRDVDALVNGVDLYTTILELAGVDVDATVPAGTTLDSVSLKPYLQSASAEDQRDSVYGEAFGGTPASAMGCAMRADQYKLIIFDSGEEFFNLETDPFEQNPLDLGSLTSEEDSYYVLLQELLDLMDAPCVTP